MNEKKLLEVSAIATIVKQLRRCEEAYNKGLTYYSERESIKALGMIEFAYELELISETEYTRLRDRAYTVNTNSVINR